MTGVRSFWWAAVSVVVVLVGSLGPWARRLGLTVDGTDDEVVLIAACIAAAGLVAFVLTRDRRVLAVPLLAGLISATLVVGDLKDPAGPFGGPGPNVRLEWGIWLTLGGSIGLSLASALLLAEGATRAARLLGGQARLLPMFSDDAIVNDFAKRLSRRRDRRTEVLKKLAAQIHGKALGELVEELTPVRELDYARYPIELVVSAPEAARRLYSVEKEPFTVEWIERSIKPGDVFYDIGANVGAYSLIAAKVTANRARVFAFEPAAPSFRDLSRNVLTNDCGRSVTPLPIALWSESGMLPFTLKSLGGGAARHRAGETELASEKPLTGRVVALRLDDLVEWFDVPVPTHAKIDVDGYELEVLRGAERTLTRPEWQSIIIELDAEETERNRAISALLAEAGFDHRFRHTRRPSERFPHPERRPDIYWTFTRAERRSGNVRDDSDD